MDSSSIQSGLSSRRMYKYDVFLSFKGTETRNTFIDHLYAHLIRRGIFAFKNDKDLEEGKNTSPQVLQAINDSRVSIIVLSKGHANLTWCLDEMTAIAECRAAGQTVLPVFCVVNPSDVQYQMEMYKKAFDLQTEKLEESPDKVDKRRRALEDFTNLHDWVVQEKPGFGEIEKIVEEIIKTLGHKFSGLANDLIGIQFGVKELENLLTLSSEDDDFRVLGIWGMDGIGKTTYAKVLYDRISYQFDACCFIEDVSKTYRDSGSIAVQKQILQQTQDEINLETYSPFEIAEIVRNRLSNKKVLIVFDNVDESEQMEELALDPELLDPGSRIIVTTRDRHVLTVYGADKVYEVPLLTNDDAYELFRRKAFKWDDTSSGFKELNPKVLKYAQNLPLAIQVLGSFFNTTDANQRANAFDGNNPPDQIMDVLRISFEELNAIEREIFLHIACFFNGKRVDDVKRILDCCELYPESGIPVLIKKSFIIIRDQEIQMHKMLQELGKKIVREKSSDNPELWSRLWLYKDFQLVMTAKMEPIHVEALVLDQQEDASELSSLDAEEFSKMRDLTLLILYHKNFSGNLNFLSNKLQYLSWHGYPFTSLPSSFEPDRLVELNIPGSSIKRLWEGIKHLPYLRRVDLSGCIDLEMTPDFSKIPNLEQLDLTGCTNLLRVHPSIARLKKLAFLSLRNCSNLDSVSIQSLDLPGCTILL